MSSEFFSDETCFVRKFDLEIIPRVFCLANDSFQIFSDFRFHLSTQVLIGKSKPEIVMTIGFLPKAVTDFHKFIYSRIFQLLCKTCSETFLVGLKRPTREPVFMRNLY